MSAQPKTVLITGCTPGGIGYALALEFLSQGFQVIGTARDVDTLQTLRDNGIDALELEITNEESISRLKKEVQKRLKERELDGKDVGEDDGKGRLDILINNAGISHTVPCLDLTLSGIQQVFSVNLFGTMRMIQAFALMIINARGVIVNIGSVAGIVPYVFGGAYTASKAALHAYSDILEIEMAPFGVRVITVITGGVRSRISQRKKPLFADSLYKPIEDYYMNRQGASQHSAMATEVYARKVVNDVLKPKTTGHIWHGDRALLVRVLHWILPGWFWTGYFSRKFGLDKLSLFWQKRRM